MEEKIDNIKKKVGEDYVSIRNNIRISNSIMWAILTVVIILVGTGVTVTINTGTNNGVSAGTCFSYDSVEAP